MNKRTIKTLKLYMKTAFNPILTFFSLAVMIGICVMLVRESKPLGDKEYMSMICVVGANGQIGVIMMNLFAAMYKTSCKFFLSTADAKRFMTVFPVVVPLSMSLIWNIIVCAICMTVQPEALPDLFLVCSVSTVAATAAVAAFGNSGLAPIYLAGIIVCFMASMFIGGSERFRNGFGLSLGTSAAVSAAVLVVGIAALAVLLSAWWKKTDRIPKKVNNLAIMMNSGQVE